MGWVHGRKGKRGGPLHFEGPTVLHVRGHMPGIDLTSFLYINRKYEPMQNLYCLLPGYFLPESHNSEHVGRKSRPCYLLSYITIVSLHRRLRSISTDWCLGIIQIRISSVIYIDSVHQEQFMSKFTPIEQALEGVGEDLCCQWWGGFVWLARK